jgi:phosphate transport system permease protein
MNNTSTRKIKNVLMISLSFLALAIALIPLISILAEAVARGAPAINLNFIFQELPPLGQSGGGIGPAIEGTLVIVGLASAIGVPIGIGAGIFLAEFPDNKLAYMARFLNDVLTNMPSIVIGILGWTLIVVVIGWSVLAGAVALAIMMIPIVTRTTEEAIRLVPASMREAAIALGIPQWKTSTTVVLSSAKRGIATGVLLSVARISGETAPLLLTILGSRFWLSGLNEPATALPLAIYNFSGSPYSVDWARAWGASLILILIVLSISVVVRYFTREKFGGASR